MPNNGLEQQILDYVTRPGYKPVKAAGLAKRLRVTKDRRAEFEAALDKLIRTGNLREHKRGLLRAQTAADTLVGIIKRTRSGAGFLIPHEAPPGLRSADVFISQKDMRDAHTGDEVLVRLLKERRTGGQRTGRIEEIVERASNTFVGTYVEGIDQGFVQVDGGAFTEPVAVDDPGAKGARPGDKVVIEMLRFPTHSLPGEAVLTKVLGPRGEPGVDTLSIVHEFGLPQEFPEEVREEARLQAQQFDEADLSGRLDLTKETIVTIDPKDARDFDDAISLERTRDGHWHLGVHIADVAHFVEPGSALDREARLRGNSIYLPQMVIPMLPEVISNALASLQQGKVRYTKSAFIEFTSEGVPVHTRFANSAIKVTRRFAYEEVLPIVHEPERHRTRISAKVRALLARMHELAMILRRRRFQAGALEMHIGEVKIDFDEEGRVAGAREVEHDESHQIIEEFMLAANMAVATELADRGIPFLRRIHPDPSEIKLKAFAEFVNALGFRLKQWQSREHLQALIDEAHGKPTEHAVNYALLRSMAQAEYAPVEMGHYALAVENYCHFTSPIRRYPDLTIHRLMDHLARGGRVRAPNEIELTKVGKHCSATERRADRAERELVKVKLLTYMEERIDEELEAVITGVESFGLFCQGVELPVEGMIHISALDPNDYFYHDPATFSLIGRRSGRQYRLGDWIRVRVAHVNVERRELDFRLAPRESARKPSRKEQPAGREDRRGAKPARKSAGRTRAGTTSDGESARGRRSAGRKKRRR